MPLKSLFIHIFHRTKDSAFVCTALDQTLPDILSSSASQGQPIETLAHWANIGVFFIYTRDLFRLIDQDPSSGMLPVLRLKGT